MSSGKNNLFKNNIQLDFNENFLSFIRRQVLDGTRLTIPSDVGIVLTTIWINNKLNKIETKFLLTFFLFNWSAKIQFIKSKSAHALILIERNYCHSKFNKLFRFFEQPNLMNSNITNSSDMIIISYKSSSSCSRSDYS